MHVAVLLGGCSLEHDVSLASAEQVLSHLDRRRWQVTPVWLDRDGGWWPRRTPLAAAEPFVIDGPVVDRAALHGPLRPGAALDWLLDQAGVEVVFPVLHGAFGEDGTVQGLLELYGVPFVGSGCAASAVAMDKLRTRQVLAHAGVPLAEAYHPTVTIAGIDPSAEFARISAAVGTPAFVKGDLSGSTFGVHRVASEQDLRDFRDRYAGRFRRWFAERGAIGEEITVPVLGNSGGALQPLPPVGIYPVHDTWFTTDAKYRPGACEEIVPPRGLSPAAIREVQDLARRCHEALVCDGMSRTDMIVTAQGPVVLEVNTIPGLTRQSLLPRAAAAAGLPFPALMDRLLELALEQHGRRSSGATRATAKPHSVPAAVHGAEA